MAFLIQPLSLPTLQQLSRDFVLWASSQGTHAYHVASGDRMSRDGFILYCAKHYGPVALVDTSNNQVVNKPSGAVWWDWDDDSRRVVRQVVMEPTSEPVTASGQVLNRWYILKEEMAKPDPDAQLADISVLLDHLMYVSDGDAEGVGHFLNWMAELWRNPDIKIPTGIMFYSRHGRVGKSILAKLMGHVFGRSLVKSVAGSVLHRNFMDAVEHQRIMFLNELARADKQDNYETFKSLISEPVMEFEGKGRASKAVRNCLHWVITTNNPDCLPLMMGDGRILVLRCESKRRDDAYYDRLVDWIEGPGPELLAGCLSRWAFPKGWNPHAPVPQTEASVRTQIESRSGLAALIEELVAERRPPFDKDAGRCVSVIEQLSVLYPANTRGARLNNRTLPRVFQELGYVQIPVNMRTQRGTNTSTRVWCWRNIEHWTDATGLELGDYLGD